MQVLVASNSNKPTLSGHQGPGLAAKKQSVPPTEVAPEQSSVVNNLQNQTKFKSLGDLHMEKGLPAAVPPPRYNHNRKIASRIKGSKDRLVKRLSLYVTENL